MAGLGLGLGLGLSRYLGGGGGFSPAILFAGGEPGVWYDPSDLTTLFQDTAGTTPVTTPGQTVALMLDKSKGLTLGPELVTNGGFDSADGWALAASATVSDGVLNVNQAGSTQVAYQSLSITPGAFYEFEITCLSFTSGSVVFSTRVGAIIVWANINAAGTYRGIGRAGAANTGIRLLSSGAGFVGTIDNISVKELPGFHATQPTTAARPTYGIVPETGRRNLLTYSEQFDNAYWFKLNATVSTSTVVDPAGGTSARLLAPDASASVTWVFSPIIITSVVTSISVFAKYSGKTWMSQSNSNGSLTYASFNLLTGEVGFVATGYAATMESAGDGWYRCTVRTPTNFNQRAIFAVSDTDGGISATPNGSDGILLWGAQLEAGSTATAYQKVTTEFDVTEAGVTSLGYMSFDGVDDWMVTPTITPAIDKAQVFAGVRVFNDVVGIILEHSVDTVTNNGSLALYRDSTGYGFNSKGTTLRAAKVTTGFSSPDDSVLRGLGDISGDNSQLFRNQSLLAENTGDQGTGNYLAYPMYIGRRGGTSLSFKGDIYSLITRFGANLEVAQIESTEAYVAGKTAGVDL